MVTPDAVNPHFQRVRESNLQQLLAFMREFYAHQSMPWREGETRRAVGELLANPTHGSAWFIAAAGEAIGYVMLTLAFSVEFGGTFALLDELYIREPWTGKGIGHSSISFVEQQARAMGAHAIRLETGHGNERAVRFYERHGIHREERYLMTKRLN